MKKFWGVLSVILGLLGFVAALPFDIWDFDHAVAVFMVCIMGGLLAVFFVLRTFNLTGISWKYLHTGEKIGAIMLTLLGISFCLMSAFLLFRLIAGLLFSHYPDTEVITIAFTAALLLLLLGGGALRYLFLTFTGKQKKDIRNEQILDNLEVRKE